AGERDLQRLSQTRVGQDPSVKGLNFFNATDQSLLKTMQRGEFNIHGWRRADLLKHVQLTPSAMSRQLKRLRMLGLIKSVTHTYRYYLTRLGRAAIAAACSLTRFNIVPAMATSH
ncbi:ArsR family transcriptional regulator, partial [Caballeronia sordidicola]|uniref:ArsR family transcriptional regulator n=1 Tax=Caballeronia sordidicola TaxID=196367 RepID=UPI00117DE6A8